MIITSGIGLTCNIINIWQLSADEFSGGEEEESESGSGAGSLISSIKSYSTRRSIA